MATAKTNRVTEMTFEWSGKNRRGKPMKGEIRAKGTAAASAQLRRQGIIVNKIRQRRVSGGRRIKAGDIAIFTRQLATMLRAGIPLLQSFEIVGEGHPNPSVARLLESIRKDIETGTSMANSFRKHPRYFNALFCSLVEAGEVAGILEAILDRLATYMEKTEALKRKLKSALMYPVMVILALIAVITVMMVFVIPTFKTVFESMGAKLPGPTQVIMNMSDFMVDKWYYLLFGTVFIVYFLMQCYRRSEKFRDRIDEMLLNLPIFGSVIRKGVIARWTRTLSTMFSAGVPLIESLNSVAGAAGNSVYRKATEKIQQDVSTGTGLAMSMSAAQIFPSMVIQMTTIGEESGSLDDMLGNVADFYEDEVDEAVKGISSLIEPLIIIILGVVVGGMVVALYLPIFNLGNVVG